MSFFFQAGIINYETELSFCNDLGVYPRRAPRVWYRSSDSGSLVECNGDLAVHDVSDPKVRRLGVDALPAVVGWLTNGEKHILKTGISVKDIKSAVEDLSALLEGF
ncbi:hypothetical protein U1Q18_013600 [Sarracenia purpurea var. burkii]